MRLKHFLILIGGLALFVYSGMDLKNDVEFTDYTGQRSEPALQFFSEENVKDFLDLTNLSRNGFKLSPEFQKVISSIIICFFAGWALGRLLMQFKGFILSFIGLFILFNFILVQAEIVIPIFNFAIFLKVIEFLRSCVSKMGIISFLVFLLGVWIGGKGLQRVSPPAQSNS